MFQVPAYFKARDRTSFKASHPDACYYTYHYLSCMFLLLKIYKNCLHKTIFDVAITTSITIRFIIMPVVKTWCYQAHSHHMVYLPPKYNNLKSLSGHPKKAIFVTQRLYGKTPVERWDLVHGRIVKRIIFGKMFFFTNDT